MATLSPKGLALVRAVRHAFQPTDADRLRLASVLWLRLPTSGCRTRRAAHHPPPARPALLQRGFPEPASRRRR
jgi:hypothetical protein